MARNTNQAPVVRRPELEELQGHVNRVFDVLAQGHGELLQRQQILEAAFLSLARDVEYILGGEPEEVELSEEEQADDPRLHGPAGENRNVEQDESADFERAFGVAEVTEWEESPEEEAARLIAEAEAANEGPVEPDAGWPPQDS